MQVPPDDCHHSRKKYLPPDAQRASLKDISPDGRSIWELSLSEACRKSSLCIQIANTPRCCRDKPERPIPGVAQFARTRSVQKLVEVCSDDPDQAGFLSPRSAHITKLSLDTNGNHVIQRFLRHMPGERSQFVHDTVLGDILIITRHRHGCCVFQRCIDAATDEQRKPLMDVIVHNAEKFIQDPFGNYVVQYVLERANADDVRMIASKLLGRLASLSMQKFSSNVVEKALQIAPGEVQQDMISELIDKKTLRSLLRDQFGNYVMQRALLASPKEQVHDVVDAISPHMTELFSTHPASARRLASRLLKINPNALPQNLYVRMVDSGAHSKQR